MATNQPSSGPDRDAPSSDQAQWLTDSRTKIEQNRPLAPAQRVEQFREIVKGRTLSDLEELAKLIVAAPFSLSQIEERELAVRVRELLSPKELNELVESRDRDRRLQILEQPPAGLSRHTSESSIRRMPWEISSAARVMSSRRGHQTGVPVSPIR
ncbi:MAG: hypothetical protein UY87_C0012G0017 [Candidatus Peribacteria bacterium GW2011_GWC2_54_8]|nr:MAG: hypothetical protein UY87_C0012G0017 [Candidatus Peribacteria bacterium GW2011_GWC2_54_8]